MKKTMIAVAMVFTVALAHAAAVDWTASGIVDPVATAAAGKNTPANGWLGYLILASDYESISVDLAKGDIDSLVKAALVPVKATSNKGAFAAAAAAGNVASGMQEFKLIVLDSATLEGAKNYYVASGSANVDPELATTILFGSQATATKNAANWTSVSVPEPTSGLLLLLGMAGLALKRKRA